LASSGVGNPQNRWNPWRRWTKRELEGFPMTFRLEDTGYQPGSKYLLHNHACCMWDMRKPLWYEPDTQGCCRFVFNFTERIVLVGENWETQQDSEDWAFSHDLWRHGAKTFITRRLKIIHMGGIGFENWGNTGLYQNGDEDTAPQWRKELEELGTPVQLKGEQDDGELEREWIAAGSDCVDHYRDAGQRPHRLQGGSPEPGGFPHDDGSRQDRHHRRLEAESATECIAGPAGV
jgi:hypothetical protein